jgi:hypothetical protein
MVAVILMAALLAVVLLVALAVFGKNPTVLEAQRAERRLGTRQADRVTPRRLRELVEELLASMGLDVLPDTGDRDALTQRFVAVHAGPIREARHVILLEAGPPGDLVEGTTALSLAEQIKTEPGGVGLLVTPYAIDRAGIAGLEPAVELVDGPRLRALVAQHLPDRIAEVAGYRLGRLPVSSTPSRSASPSDRHAHSRA